MGYDLELITRLNAKARRYSAAVGGAGYGQGITWQDVAGAMVGLPPQHVILLNVLRGGERGNERQALRQWVYDLLICRMSAAGEKPRKGLTLAGVCSGVATIALYSHFAGFGMCESCAGVGYQKPAAAGLRGVCVDCNGTGRRPWPYRARLQMAGWGGDQMTEDAYRKTWAKYERHAAAALAMLENQAEDWILIQLGIRVFYDCGAAEICA